MNNFTNMNYFITSPMKKRTRENKIFMVFVFIALISLTIVIDPRDVSVLSCHFKSMSGFNCPTCGLSRSFYAMAHLNISEAYGYHFMGPVFYFFVIVFFAKYSIELFINKEINNILNPAITKVLLSALFGIWLLFWVRSFF